MAILLGMTDFYRPGWPITRKQTTDNRVFPLETAEMTSQWILKYKYKYWPKNPVIPGSFAKTQCKQCVVAMDCDASRNRRRCDLRPTTPISHTTLRYQLSLINAPFATDYNAKMCRLKCSLTVLMTILGFLFLIAEVKDPTTGSVLKCFCFF